MIRYWAKTPLLFDTVVKWRVYVMPCKNKNTCLRCICYSKHLMYAASPGKLSFKWSKIQSCSFEEDNMLTKELWRRVSSIKGISGRHAFVDFCSRSHQHPKGRICMISSSRLPRHASFSITQKSIERFNLGISIWMRVIHNVIPNVQLLCLQLKQICLESNCKYRWI